MFSRTVLYVVGAMLVLVAGVAASACGGSAEGAQVASLTGTTEATATGTTSTSTGATSDDPQEVLLAYAKCMRKEGIDMPDPEFSGGARGTFRARVFGGPDRDDPKFEKADEKCRPILQSLRQQFDPERQQQFQEAALKFAKCMRAHGIDMPDPDFSGSQPGGRGGAAGPFGAAGIDPDDPKFRAAQDACESAFDDLRGGPGGGPPRAGGTQSGQGSQ